MLDLGCGPGSITTGLAAAVTPDGATLGIDAAPGQVARAADTLFRSAAEATTGAVAGAGAALPVRTGVFDVAFAHALFEHVPDPAAMLGELRRALRPRGLLAVCSSDWNTATIQPRTKCVETALQAYWRLRQRSGTDPFTGGNLPTCVQAAGFTVYSARPVDRIDMAYGDLGAYLRDRLTTARHSGEDHSDELADAARAAAAWAATNHPGTFIQRWVEVLATPAG